jgi:hypothetical protein
MVKKAVLCGINYLGSSSQLAGCLNDVINFKNILINKFKWDPDDIVMLTESNSLKPTKKNIEDSLLRLISNVNPGDTLVFYYSGHGSNIRDTNSDENDLLDEVLVPLDYNAAGIISDDWLFSNIIKKIPPKTSFYSFVDACHSGSMFDLKYNLKYIGSTPNFKTNMPFVSNNWSNKYSFSFEKVVDVPGNIFCFSGCRDDQTSADSYLNNKNTGAFSHCLQLILDRDTPIQVHEVLKDMNCLLQILGFSQRSVLSLSSKNSFECNLDL